MLPISRGALLLLTMAVAAFVSSTWVNLRTAIHLDPVARQELGWVLAPSTTTQLAVNVLLVVVAAFLVTRASWLGAIAGVVTVAVCSVLAVHYTIPSAQVFAATVVAGVLAAWAVWMVLTWVDWPFPTVPALYAIGLMTVAATLPVVLFHPGGDVVPSGPLLRTMVPWALAAVTVGLAAVRVVRGSLVDTEVLDFFFALAAAVTAGWAVALQGAQHVQLFVVAMTVVGFVVVSFYQLPRRLYHWARREQENPSTYIPYYVWF